MDDRSSSQINQGMNLERQIKASVSSVSPAPPRDGTITTSRCRSDVPVAVTVSRRALWHGTHWTLCSVSHSRPPLPVPRLHRATPSRSRVSAHAAPPARGGHPPPRRFYVICVKVVRCHFCTISPQMGGHARSPFYGPIRSQIRCSPTLASRCRIIPRWYTRACLHAPSRRCSSQLPTRGCWTQN